MATTFNVFYLGTGPAIDPSEGNATSENAGALVGNTYGTVVNPLVDNIQSFSPGTGGFGSGTSNAYDTDNNFANEKFRLDGGADQTFDGVASYFATITYTDGTTAAVKVIVFQDTAGRLYLAPQPTYDSTQAALEAKPIRSLNLTGLDTNSGVLGGSRYDANYAVCFTSGTAIRTPRGDVAIDGLRIGDLVSTMDNGPQPVRWIGRQLLRRQALLERPALRPILIRKGVLGAARDLLVSPQHGMLLGRDHLVRAKHLVAAPGSAVRIAHGRRSVTYIHLMFDAHQIIFAEGAPSESFYPGPMAQRMVAPDALAELGAIFPGVCAADAGKAEVALAYGATARSFLGRQAVPGAFGRLACARA